jgi:hypothetical protein
MALRVIGLDLPVIDQTLIMRRDRTGGGTGRRGRRCR